MLALAVAMLVVACGGSSSSGSDEPSGTFRVDVTEARFPTSQQVGQTTLLRLAFRNSGRRTIPALTVTITVAGKQGVDSSLPFAVHDPQPNLAQAERPVWVLEEKYPRLLGSSEPAGATTSSPKTFDFGPLKPGETTTGIWKLSAVRPGKYTLLYRVGVGLAGDAKAKTANGATPGGSITAEISTETPETEVTDSGEIVEVRKGK